MSEDFDSDRLRRELKDPSVNVEGRWAPAFIYVCLALIIVFTLWANWALIKLWRLAKYSPILMRPDSKLPTKNQRGKPALFKRP